MTSNALHRDPVCGMPVRESTGLSCEMRGATYWLCSELCRQRFADDPDQYLGATDREVEVHRTLAYFSMEIALQSEIPTYSGGLGVLAGDTLRACADLQMPVVGVTLVHRLGYLRQRLDERGRQIEEISPWDPAEHADRLEGTVDVKISGRSIRISAWRYRITGERSWTVPVILLDTDLAENAEEDRHLTDVLYGGDQRYRLAQEIVLGVGGLRMLRVLGYASIHRFQLNEGHSAMLIPELLAESRRAAENTWDFHGVRQRCVFTTHTPVPAGHDRFAWPLVDSLLACEFDTEVLRMLGGREELNMTRLALNAAHYVNGVAKRHAEVSQQMFPDYVVEAVTNGVHSATWTCPSFRELYDRFVPGWRSDAAALRSALSIPPGEVWTAHAEAKRALAVHVSRATGVELELDKLTIGFARRATEYKRTTLIFLDLDRLRAVARRCGGLQLVFAGKAHPKDEAGKRLIFDVFEAARALEGDVSVIYLPDYDMDTARLVVSGSDLWLNTPRKPHEASGTSGMKAALNGVPQLSVLDGWWLEGHVEGVTGWAIGTRDPESGDDDSEAAELYDKLDSVIGPLFQARRGEWVNVMRHSIAINGSFFSAHRMVQQYAASAYLR